MRFDGFHQRADGVVLRAADHARLAERDGEGGVADEAGELLVAPPGLGIDEADRGRGKADLLLLVAFLGGALAVHSRRQCGGVGLTPRGLLNGGGRLTGRRLGEWAVGVGDGLLGAVGGRRGAGLVHPLPQRQMAGSLP